MQRVLVELLRQLDGDRFEPWVIVLNDAVPSAIKALEGIPVRFARPLPRTSMLWPRKLSAMIREVRPTVVHAHSGAWYKAALASRLAGVPSVVYTDHGRPLPDPVAGRFVDHLASRMTRAVIPVSDTVREALAHFVHRPDGMAVILNGVDCDVFADRAVDSSERATLGVPSTGLLLGSVGRLEEVKGYDVMIDAMAELTRRDLGPELPTLVIVGDGNCGDALRSRAAALGLGDRVRFFGFRDDIPDLLAAFDVFTLSSRSEGTSMSLLEGMASGTCPIVTNVGGNPVVLGPGLAHRLVPPDDVTALADAWHVALADVGTLRSDGAKARSRVLAEFSLESMVRQYENLYSSLVGH